MLKKLFGGKKKPGESETKELTIEDLITLERYDEALDKLKQRVKLHPKDLHAHLKIAEVHVALKNVTKAIDEYVYVADSQVDDGFFDKGIAVLSKAAKLAPGDDTIPKRINRYRTLKKLERRRSYAIAGLMANKSTGSDSAANSALVIEMLWNKISKSHLVANLEGDHLKKLFTAMTMTRIEEDQILARPSEPTQIIYLLVDGVVEAGASINGKYFDIRTFTTGDLIGESTLLERKPWPATYKVIEPGTVFTLDRAGLEVAMIGHEDPRGFISILRQQHHDRDVAANIMRMQS